MFISITGRLGSGKSTLCCLLAQKYGFEIYSTGTIQRKLALDLGLGTLEFNKLMRKNPKYDRLIDDEMIKLSQERQGDRLIFDSRMAWHFVPNSFKVYTTIDPLVAAQRVVACPRGPEEVYIDAEEASEKLLERARVENIRFKELYRVDNQDYTNYNLIMDTTWLSQELAAAIIYDRYQHYKPIHKQAEVVMSPKSLTPGQPTAQDSEGEDQTANFSPPGDYYQSDPIKIVCLEDCHYVVSGHAKLVVALRHHLPYIFAVSTAS